MRWLDPIAVIDECHVVLNSERDFRPQVAQIGKLVRALTQMVRLTATLPPSMENELCLRTKHDRTAVTIYRACISCPNVTYRVWPARIDRVGRGFYHWIESE
jgi:superfamily II DNA helicase RecQ